MQTRRADPLFVLFKRTVFPKSNDQDSMHGQEVPPSAGQQRRNPVQCFQFRNGREKSV